MARRGHHSGIRCGSDRGDQGDALLVSAVQIYDDDVDGRLGERLERAGLVGHRAENHQPRQPAKSQQQGVCQTEAVVHDEDPDLVHLWGTSAARGPELSVRPVPCGTLWG